MTFVELICIFVVTCQVHLSNFVVLASHHHGQLERRVTNHDHECKDGQNGTCERPVLILAIREQQLERLLVQVDSQHLLLAYVAACQRSLQANCALPSHTVDELKKLLY